VIPELRRRFNGRWTAARYSAFLNGLDRTAGTHIGFRVSETPVFLPPSLVDRMIRCGQELYGQIANNSTYREASERAIPSAFRVPRETEHPLFVQADFGLVEGPDGELAPRLVEIQGFPSVYALQIAIALQYAEAFDLEDGLTPFLGCLTEAGYFSLLRKVILNGHAPEEVILLEISPYQQKTLGDFLLTERRLGIRIACISEVEKRGKRLFFQGAPVKRIYNRVIVDELLRTGMTPGFRFNDDLEVEWAGHPNWFFRLSKFSLPWFKHECVPETWFLNELGELPRDLGEYVLKPLYSFAGLGVKIGPTYEEIQAIPEGQRADFILQRRVDFVPTILTPAGMTKVEVRIMYIWDGYLRPVTTVLRTGRGKMMGVDFNKDLNWVGASAGFLPPGK
jgi:hypothetical protein